LALSRHQNCVVSHECEIGLAPNIHGWHVQHLKLRWHTCEVNEVENWLNLESWHQFLREFRFSFLKSRRLTFYIK
jgi:hypothetical protein